MYPITNLLGVFILFILFFCSFAQASNSSNIFQNKSGCFLLYDITHKKLIEKYNTVRCVERITPASTFKVPLSIMAFDRHLITQQTIFKWDGQNRRFPFWNKDQTPQSWFKNSVLWVSQELTPKFGMSKIKSYLKEFHYGNQDFSGDPHKNNGLTHAWLSSSLKISADEQLDFLKILVSNKLPVSQEAMINTKENMYLETLANGYKLYGKTGTGSNVHQPINTQRKLEDGWFIGFLQKADQNYVLVLNFTDQKPPYSTEAAGPRAKAMVKSLLAQMKL